MNQKSNELQEELIELRKLIANSLPKPIIDGRGIWEQVQDTSALKTQVYTGQKGMQILQDALRKQTVLDSAIKRNEEDVTNSFKKFLEARKK